MSQGEGRIEQLARNVAERTLPDWKVALQEADGDNERALIEQLRLVDGIIRSYDRHAAPAASDARGGSAAIKSGVLLGQRYRVLNHLGRGGMGEVWRAWDARLRVHVAIKVLQPERFGGDRALEMARREVRSARVVASANVCRIFDLIETDGRTMISMEYVDGRTLDNLLRSRPALDLREATEIASQFLAGLEAIHAAGLLHRDVKPENIMITQSMRVVLMDFGLVKPQSDPFRSVWGTPAYMSPEQRDGARLDARSDLFSAAVVLSEMLVGDAVRDPDARVAFHQGLREEPPRLPDSPWRPVLTRALSRTPEARHGSARALIRSLEEVMLRVDRGEDVRPYPGLQPFTRDDAEYFFGREVEVEALWSRLRRLHFLALIGPSGAGKSSFIRAGLTPAMPEGWRCVVFTPGSSPFAALADALAPEFCGYTHAIRKLIHSDHMDDAVSSVSSWRNAHEQVLIVVDQFEEIFTLNDLDVQRRFTQLLARLVLDADARVLLSMRDDFLLQCHEHKVLSPIYSELTPLQAPVGPALRRALVRPALRCGYRFEDEDLVDEILSETYNERGALPLLAFLMSVLWENRDRDAGVLTREAYRRVGGVAGALARHAESTLDRVGADRIPIVRTILLALVTAQGTRVARDIDEIVGAFDDETKAREVVQALIDARLLTAFDASSAGDEKKGSRRVEIISESLLSAWPRLVRWRSQEADSAQMRDQLRLAARVWHERGRPRELLWDGSSRRELQLWRERFRGRLTQLESAFARAIEEQARRRRTGLGFALAGTFLLLLGLLATIVVLWDQAVKEAKNVEAHRLLALGQVEADRNPTAALAYAIASLELATDPEMHRFALETLWREPVAIRLPETRRPLTLDFSPDGKWLAVGSFDDPLIRLWPSDGGAPRLLDGHRGFVQSVSFGPRSDALASWARGDRQLRVWSIPEGSSLRTVETSDDFQPRIFLGSTRLVVVSNHGGPSTEEWMVRSWPIGGGEPTIERLLDRPHLGPIDPTGSWLASWEDSRLELVALDPATDGSVVVDTGHSEHIRLAAFGPGGDRLATVGERGEIRIWSPRAGLGRPWRVLDARQKVRHALFDPTGSKFVVATEDTDEALLWDLLGPPGAEPLRFGLDGSTGPLAFDPTGRWLATSDESGAAIWLLERPRSYVLRGHESKITGLAFSPDGDWIASSSWDGTVRLWPLRAEEADRTRIIPQRREEGPATLYGLAVDPSGRRLLTSADGGRVWILDLDTGSRQELEGFRGIAEPVVFGPEGRFAAAAASWGNEGDEVIRVWDLERGGVRVLEVGDGKTYTDLAFTSDGGLVSAGFGGLRLWGPQSARSELLREGRVWQVATDRTGRYLLSCGRDRSDSDGEIVWHDRHAGIVRVLDGHGSRARAVALDPSGKIAVSGDRDGTVRVGPVTDSLVHLLFGHEGAVRAVAVSPDAAWIASAGDDRTIRLWRMPTGRPLNGLPPPEFLRHLRSMTNLHVQEVEGSPMGYRLRLGSFPGWTAPEKRPL